MTPVAALQAALAGEHAAVYLYGVLGGQVSRSQTPELADLVATGYAEHIARRDALNVLVSRHHADPVASAAAYRTPDGVDTPDGARALARRIEDRCLQLYGQVVEHTVAADRRWAVTALRDAALEVIEYGARPTNFPGMTWS